MVYYDFKTFKVLKTLKSHWINSDWWKSSPWQHSCNVCFWDQLWEGTWSFSQLLVFQSLITVWVWTTEFELLSEFDWFLDFDKWIFDKFCPACIISCVGCLSVCMSNKNVVPQMSWFMSILKFFWLLHRHVTLHGHTAGLPLVWFVTVEWSIIK